MILARSQQARGTQRGRFPAALVGGLMLAVSLSGAPAHADSGMYRGGSGLTGAFADKLSLPLSLSWRYTSVFSPYNPSSPAVVGDTVYFAAGTRVYAVDTTSGALKWRYPQDQPLDTAIFTSPAVGDNMVYFGAGNGKLYALHTETGKYAWAFDTRSSIGSSPVLVDGILYFGSADGRLWAIDSRTGDSVTSWKGGLKMSDEVSGAPAVSNGIVYALSLDQVLHAVGAATGKERWSVRLGGSVLRISPVISGEYAYIASGNTMICLLARNGVRRWTTPMPTEITASPAINDESIFVVTNDNRVYSLDPRTGRSKWKTNPQIKFDVVSAPALSGNTLFVGTTQGGIYALDTTTGGTKWSYMTQPSTTNADSLAQYTNIASPPVIADQTLYVLSDDGALSAYRADAADSLAPTISDIEPDMGIIINGTPPIHFEAKLVDEGSGLNIDSIKVTLDGEGIVRKPDTPDSSDKPGYKFDAATSLLEYDTPEPVGASAVRPLADGRHTFTVSVADWEGNVASKSWSFVVDNSIARTARKRRTNDTRNNRGMGGRGGFPGGGGRGGGRGGGGNGGGG